MFDLQKKVLSREWSVGLTITALFLLIIYYDGLQFVEQTVYDWSIQRIERQVGDKVVIVAIDENTLTQLGDWAWSRAVYSQLIDLIGHHAKVIGSTLELTHSHHDPSLAYIDELLTFYNNIESLQSFSEDFEKFSKLIATVSSIRARLPTEQASLYRLIEFYHSSTLAADLPDALSNLVDKLSAIRVELDSDRKLVNSFRKAGNVILSFSAHLSRSLVHNSGLPPLSISVLKFQLENISNYLNNKLPKSTQVVSAKLPFERVIQVIAGLGYVGFQNNSRQQPLVVNYNDNYLPSLSLLLFAHSLGLNRADIHVKLGEGIRLNSFSIPTNHYLEFKPFFYNSTPNLSPFPIYSVAEVLSGKVSPEAYKNKIVLVGSTLSSSPLYSTPLGKMPAVVILAHSVASLLNQDFLISPRWGYWLQIIIFTFCVFYLSVLLPRLRANTGKLVSVSIVASLSVSYFYLLKNGFLIELLSMTLLIPCVHIALLIKRAMVAYQDAFRLHPDAVESNRLLGLAFQGQGHLDLAFEKFRLCPLDDANMGLIYNLALDHEMKRQFRRAGVVYRYLHNHNPAFRDIEKRMERLDNLKKPNTGNRPLDWLLEEGGENPRLGRYQIEKQLGKGAMGIVYLGREPKLNRVVAIKTLALVQEFESDELQEVTTRFFREASAAGRLRHPHIISIYDAGEEYDLAYIAMEYFSGGDLVPYTKQDHLLPITTVRDIVSCAAEALDYAHSHGIIHRDIKPANIMYNQGTGKLKITDFGIARIVDASKTKTGIILGTPSYMSPEQLAGKQLDGRTDLFSLGVMLYQLLTGQLPFQADSMATLMFRIANDPHPDITQVRNIIPESLKIVIDTALQKEPQARYQSGIEFAQALRKLTGETECA